MFKKFFNVVPFKSVGKFVKASSQKIKGISTRIRSLIGWIKGIASVFYESMVKHLAVFATAYATGKE